MKPWFPALQLACNLGHLLTPTSALASSPLDPPPQETPRAPLGTRVGAGVSPRVPGAGWQRLRFEAVEPWIRTKQGSWQRPLGEAPGSAGPGPWGTGWGWGQGQKAQAEDGPRGTGHARTAPASKGKRGHFRPPPRRSPHQRVCPRCPWLWEHMRPRPDQGAREAPRGQRGVPRQPWPLILLGLASHPVGAHGLLPPTAAPRNTASRMEAPSGKSPWSLWGR